MEGTVCSVMAALQGGRLDGDTFLMKPAGSIRPPSQLRYLAIDETSVDQRLVWLVYDSDCPLESWPDGRWQLDFTFAGKQPWSGDLACPCRVCHSIVDFCSKYWPLLIPIGVVSFLVWLAGYQP